jgi:hypothetical protein
VADSSKEGHGSKRGWFANNYDDEYVYKIYPLDDTISGANVVLTSLQCLYCRIKGVKMYQDGAWLALT